MELGLSDTQTASDLREAMHDVFGRVNKGILSADVGSAIIQMLKDMIAAHSIDAMMPTGQAQSQQTDARQLLTDKLTRILEARQQLGGDVGATADDDDGDSEES